MNPGPLHAEGKDKLQEFTSPESLQYSEVISVLVNMNCVLKDKEIIIHEIIPEKL